MTEAAVANLPALLLRQTDGVMSELTDPSSLGVLCFDDSAFNPRALVESVETRHTTWRGDVQTVPCDWPFVAGWRCQMHPRPASCAKSTTSRSISNRWSGSCKQDG